MAEIQSTIIANLGSGSKSPPRPYLASETGGPSGGALYIQMVVALLLQLVSVGCLIRCGLAACVCVINLCKMHWMYGALQPFNLMRSYTSAMIGSCLQLAHGHDAKAVLIIVVTAASADR